LQQLTSLGCELPEQGTGWGGLAEDAWARQTKKVGLAMMLRKVVLRLSKMTDEEKGSLSKFEKQAMQKVTDATEWIIEHPTVKGMAEAIRNTEFGKVRGTHGEDGKYVVVSYQPKMAAETMSMPHLRVPPLRNNTNIPGGPHYKKMIQAVIQSRLPAESPDCGAAIDDGDCYVIGDGGKHGNQTALLAVFTTDEGNSLSKVHKTLYAHYDEEDQFARWSGLSLYVRQ